MNLDKAYKIIDDLSVIMREDDGSSFYDSSLLPHPREDIVFALLLGLKFLPDMKSEIRGALAALARYQDGVGPEPIAPSDLPPKGLSPEDLVGMLKDTLSGRRDASEAEQLLASASESSKNGKLMALEQSCAEKRAQFFAMADRVL